MSHTVSGIDPIAAHKSLFILMKLFHSCLKKKSIFMVYTKAKSKISVEELAVVFVIVTNHTVMLSVVHHQEQELIIGHIYI